ncbi:MAG TPA: hypothetical protein DEO57_04515 [Phycisphaerales bacterium]|nr:hypothetical protein [Phycisphaerales bacterium]
MDQHATDDTGLLGELSCLLICVGVAWMMIPGTVAITEGCLCVTPSYVPLILAGVGLAGVILLSLTTVSKSG